MKYHTPKAIEKLVAEMGKAIDDFNYLDTCKEANQPDGKYLDVLLEDELAHLADKCEEFIEEFDFYIKNK